VSPLSIDRDHTLVVDGVQIGNYRRRDQPVTAEFFECRVEPSEAATAVAGAMRGWNLTSADDALITELLERGAVVSRRYALMTLALRTWGAPTAAPTLTLDEVPLTAATPVTEGMIELIRQAYPPGHPDAETGTDADIRRDVGLILGGEWLGPLLDFSRVVLDRSRPVAMVIVNRAPGEAPVGGLWLSEICRVPDPAYSGLGAQLLEQVITECRDAGETALSLAVTEGNRARDLYQRLGFDSVTSITKVAIAG
jgi:GNAT superfamily N-acetyltransferase